LTGELEHLAELVRAKNEADLSIARLLGRSALSGNIGEFVAARVFRMSMSGQLNWTRLRSTPFNSHSEPRTYS
jgi:hypothetical protein